MPDPELNARDDVPPVTGVQDLPRDRPVAEYSPKFGAPEDFRAAYNQFNRPKQAGYGGTGLGTY